jgi:uncharacterized membrane protein
MGSLFELLFKYPSFVFDQADFAFAAGRSATLAGTALAVVAVAVLITYRGINTDGAMRDRLVLVSLRLALVGVLLFCLFRPSLILKAAVPQQNFLGVLIDDSRSMSIADTGGQPRTQFVQDQLSDPKQPLIEALSQRFVVRYFRFSSTADRLTNPTKLKYEGTASRLGQALERARDELSGLPLAGLVLVTDGADTSEGTLDEHLASLKARSIPVFPVGLGRERFDRDIEITRVEMPRVTLKGTSLSVDVVLKQTGFGGQSVPLQVEDEGRILSSQQVTLPRDGEAATVRVTFAAKDAGARLFRFRVPPQTDEQVTQNNTRDALVQVSNRREKILYMEGEPRYEVKFIRRAVEDDENLQVVVLLRTAEEKYWRGDVESAEELVGGFPKTREELFAYRAIILGSIEAASFSPDQLRMLADFVSKRGGGLMMIGGRRAFAEGGWAGTPVAEVLPVELEAAAANKGNQPEALWVSVKPTRAGTSYPVTQLGDSENDSTTRWGELPRLTTVNPMNRTKPGAVVLLNGTDDRRQEHVVLAYQRYGRGKSMAFPMQDSFIWKMDATIPVEDTTHSTFWRRLVRWLVDGVPDSVALSTSVDRVEPGETVSITAEVVDKAFVEVNDAHVTATVTSPSGKTTEVAMQWTVAHDGEYRGTYVPDEAGQYEIKASAVRNDQELGTNSMPMRASAGDSEYFDAAMRSSLLRRIAEETGGHFFTPADAAKLPEAISYSGRGVTVVEERDLWDMPIILVLILGLIAAEWLFRRKLGLA